LRIEQAEEYSVKVISERVRKWIERADYDMQTAEAVHKAGRYIYSIFMCQQAIEKCLKALIAYDEGDLPPIHNLRRLAQLSKVLTELDEDQLTKLDFLSHYYINARYKEDIAELSKGITEDISRSFIDFSKETIQWVSRRMK
jgi:HEPN domain-containing protein